MHPTIREKIPEIARIAARHRVKRLGVFGSATGDRFDPSKIIDSIRPLAEVAAALESLDRDKSVVKVQVQIT